MLLPLPPFQPIDAIGFELSHLPAAPEQVVSGAPTTALAELGALGGVFIGLWEASVGGMRDVEVDEYFLVIAGRASVALLDGEDEVERIELRPGVVCRLTAGSTTRWDVTETLRKIYISIDD